MSMCFPTTHLPTHKDIEDEAHKIRTRLRKIRNQIVNQKFPTYQPWEAETITTGKLEQFLKDQRNILKQYGDAVDDYYSNETIPGFAKFQKTVCAVWREVERLESFTNYGKD